MAASPAWASHDALLPRSDGPVGQGAVLALLAHAGLIGALALGLNWRLPRPDVVVSAELWSAVPQVAAPAPLPAVVPQPTPQAAPPPPPVVVVPPAPPPAPPTPARPATPPPSPAARAAAQAAEREAELAADREAAMVVEQAKQRRLARQAEATRKTQEAAEQAREAQAKAKAEAKAQAKLDARAQADAKRLQQQQAAKARDDKTKQDLTNQAALRERQEKETKAAAAAEAKAQDALLAVQREANLKRMLGQAGASGAANTATSGTVARDAAPSQAYAGRIRAYIKPNIVLTAEVSGNPITEVEVKLAPEGSVISRRISKPSTSPAWDATVLRAIDRTGTLPRDTDGRVPPVMLLVFPRQE